ncbi:MAG: hypothetical protein ACPL3P_08490 [Anaerolineales bacterium]
MNAILMVLIGFILLFAGSQLYWLFVAVASLLAGGIFQNHAIRWATYIPSLNDTLKYSVLGAVFALTAKPLAVLIAAFVSGGYLTYSIPEAIGINMSWHNWTYFIIGGIIAIVLLIFQYSYGLILLTSSLGAIFILQHLSLRAFDKGIWLAIMLILGIISQLLLLNYSEPSID